MVRVRIIFEVKRSFSRGGETSAADLEESMKIRK